MKIALSHVLLTNIKKQKLGFILLIATSFFGAIQQCITPWAIRYIVNIWSIGKHEQIAITSAVITFLIIFIVSEIIIRSQGLFVALVLPKFKKNIKSYLIRNLLQKNYKYFLESMPGSLTQKINDFSSSAERIIQIIIYNFFPIVISILLAAVFLYSIEPFYSLLIIVWFLGHTTTTWLRLKKSIGIIQHHSKIHSSITGKLCELISKIVPIKIYLGEEYELRNLEKELSLEKLSLKKAQLFFEKVKVVQSFFSLVFILALFVHQVSGFNKGYYSIGDFIFVIFITFNLINYVWFSSFQLTIFSREIGIIKDAYEVLIYGSEDPYAISNTSIKSIDKPNLIIKNLSFIFSPGIKAINNLSLEINFGEKILLYGESGIGKSTLAKILVGLYTNFQGNIIIGDKPLREFSRHQLNRLIILVEQNSKLFNRTIRENICYSHTSYSEDELDSVLHISCCHEFIHKLPNGLDTKLGEQGVSLSGGQIQRIAIAKALLFKPSILILDESTSGLEQELEKQLIRNLVGLKNQTLIVITHAMAIRSIIPKAVYFSSNKHDKKFCSEGALVC